MPLTWNVYPYDKLEQLRLNYAQALFQTSRKLAAERAKDIERWMIENAPWQDRTIKERTDAYRRRQARRKRFASSDEFQAAIDVPVPHEYLQGARLGLKVTVGDTGYSKEDMMKEKGYQDALRADARALDKINQSRTNPKLTKKQKKLPKPERDAIKKSLQRLPLKRLPSAVASYAKYYLSERTEDLPTLVQIDITHDHRIAYTLWLEVAFGGRYSIISKTVDHWANKLYNDVKRLANLIQNQGSITMGPIETQEEAYERTKAAINEEYDYAVSTRDDEYDPVTYRRFRPFDEAGRAERSTRKSYWERVGRQRYQEKRIKSQPTKILSAEELRENFKRELEATKQAALAAQGKLSGGRRTTTKK